MIWAQITLRVILVTAPESLATASAAKTAVASCLVSTMRMPNFSQATRMGEMCPPTRVKTYLTPWARSTSATFSPPCRGLFVSVWSESEDRNKINKLENIQTIHWFNRRIRALSKINSYQCEMMTPLKVTLSLHSIGYSYFTTATYCSGLLRWSASRLCAIPLTAWVLW